LEPLGQSILAKNHEEAEEVPIAPKPNQCPKSKSNEDTLNSAADSTQQQEETTSACNNNPILQLEDSFQQLSRVGSVQRLNRGPGNDEYRPVSQYRCVNVQNAELHLGQEAEAPYRGVTNAIAESRRKDDRLQGQLRQKMASLQSLKHLRRMNNSEEVIDKHRFEQLSVLPSKLQKSPEQEPQIRRAEFRLREKASGGVLKFVSVSIDRPQKKDLHSVDSTGDITKQAKLIGLRNLESVAKETDGSAAAQFRAGVLAVMESLEHSLDSVQNSASKSPPMSANQDRRTDEPPPAVYREPTLDMDAQIEEILQKQQSFK